MSTQHRNSLLNKLSTAVNAVSLTALLLSLGACAATGKSRHGQTKPPLEISYAPAIDVSYQEVADRLKQHIGVKVRWGGQVIGSENVDKLTRLTVIAYPLNAQGRPDRKVIDDVKADRFIVETYNIGVSKEGHFVTVYGPITGEEVLTNGTLKKVVPVVSAIESKEWSDSDRRYIARTGRRLPYNGLGYGYSFGFGRGFYANSYSGFYSSYPYGYYSGSHFSRGLRISRRGRH
ncbi:MAG: starvation-inducible outer membrane lipoprotein [Arenicella sp.]|jgi:starvation-inducible outer membrane lipoprotein